MGGKLFAARRVSRGIRARGESIRGYRKVGQITAKSRTTLASRRGGCRNHSNRVVEEARSGDAKARGRVEALRLCGSWRVSQSLRSHLPLDRRYGRLPSCYL